MSSSNTVTEEEINEIYQFAITLSKTAGRAILDGSSRRFASSASSDFKKNSADLVTETDQAVEALVKQSISSKFPSHTFIGEESWAAGEENVIGNGVVWIVDPIDGTTNFVHGFPYTCISIGVVVGGVAQVGVVYAPFMDTLYHGCKGKDLNQALVAFEWGSDRRSQILDKKLASFRRITGDSQGDVQGGKMVRGVRSIGSAALNFCHVAQGNLDLYWEIGCWAWDVTAGVVIAQEAGAAVVGSKSHALAVIDPQPRIPNPEQEAEVRFNLVTPQLLTGRKYVVVRKIATENTQNEQAQKHILKQFYSCVDEWDP